MAVFVCRPPSAAGPALPRPYFPDEIGTPSAPPLNDLEGNNSGVGVMGEAYGTLGHSWGCDDEDVFRPIEYQQYRAKRTCRRLAWACVFLVFCLTVVLPATVVCADRGGMACMGAYDEHLIRGVESEHAAVLAEAPQRISALEKIDGEMDAQSGAEREATAGETCLSCCVLVAGTALVACFEMASAE